MFKPHSRIVLLLIVFLVHCPFGARAQGLHGRCTQAESPKPTVTPFLSVRYAEGSVNIKICNAPLATVLRELTLKTGLRVAFLAPDVAGLPVSASVKAKSLREGIRKILDGYSYVFFSIANTPAIAVLSTPPGLKTTATRLQPELPDKSSLSTENAGPISVVAPQTLDEFQAIAVEAVFEVPGDEVDPSAQLDREQAYSQASHQALLNRALAALQSQHTQLYSEALDQLVGIEDVRATNALVERARHGLEESLRVQAVGSLSRHAESLKFNDRASVDALKQLTDDSNSNVSNIARRGLEQLVRYQDHEIAE